MSDAMEHFRLQMAGAGIRLPLRLHEEECGVVIDADGQDVFTVDVNRQRTDLEADLIGQWVVLACNTCGGFRAEVRTDG